MSRLPEGTLTMLFSDIEGSTTLLTGLGDRWGDALSAHRAIMRAAFTAHGGVEVGTEGDSFFVVFTSAGEAVLAAVEAQQGLAAHEWPPGHPLRVRMGLHTGEPEIHDDDYIGLDVHRAARIMATAHGGQIVLSEPARGLAGPALAGLEVRDLGWHRLKDLPEPQHLFDVVAPGLPADHPPLRSLGHATSLPTYAGDLVGRETELRDVVAAVVDEGARLVTLTGFGGTGKTRLAVSVARAVRERIPGDVFFVALAAATRPALMWATLAEVLGAPADVDESPKDRALRALADRPTLLVLDNLEQVVDADHVVSALLAEAPGVRVLATSRSPLHLVDERLYPLAPLRTPDEDEAASALHDVADNPAVRLFVQRARMVRPSFTLTRDNVADVVALCRRLDGLPLALELAAARSRLLGPRALLARLDGWFDHAEAAPDRPERQRTLAATIAWSHDMLPPEDQRALRRLGVFSSGVGLDAVETVVGAPGDAGELDALDAVTHLVDASLLEITEGPDGDPTVRMLETIRRFARDRLEDSGEADGVRLRHARWCVSVATDITGLLHGPRQMSALDRMDSVMEDVRAALDWTLARGASPERVSVGFALLQPMDHYWYRFGYVQEGRGWYERAMALVDAGADADSPDVVDVLHGHGVLALQQKDLATGTAALERALAMAHRLGDLSREARECNSLGVGRREEGRVDAAHELLRRSVDLARRISEPNREATALSNMVQIHMDRGEHAAAVQAAREALAADESLGDPWGVAIDQTNLVLALLYAQGPVAAYEQLVSTAQTTLALGDVELSACVVENFAAVWSAAGGGERAAALLGASDAERERAGIPRSAPDDRLLSHFVDPAREATDRGAWQRAYAAGRALTLEAAVALGERDAQLLAGARTRSST